MATPVTEPLLLMVAIDGLLLLHVPPLVVLVKVAVAAIHRFDEPPISATTGLSFTVTTNVLVVVPQLLVTA